MLTDKQEKFAHNIAIKGMNNTDAWFQAGYSTKVPLSTLYPNACRLAKNSKVKARIEALRNELTGPDILTEREYLAMLTRVNRTKLTDFQTCGADGSSYIDIGPEHEHAGSVSEITSRTEYDKDGSSPTVITKLKLLDPLQAGRDIAKVKKWGGVSEGNTTIINVEKVLIDARGKLELAVKLLVDRTTEGEVIDE